MTKWIAAWPIRLKKMNLHFASAYNAARALPLAAQQIIPILVSEDFACISGAVLLKIFSRKSVSACYAENAGSFVHAA